MLFDISRMSNSVSTDGISIVLIQYGERAVSRDGKNMEYSIDAMSEEPGKERERHEPEYTIYIMRRN